MKSQFQSVMSPFQVMQPLILLLFADSIILLHNTSNIVHKQYKVSFRFEDKTIVVCFHILLIYFDNCYILTIQITKLSLQ